MSEGFMFKTVTIEPDIWYDVTVNSAIKSVNQWNAEQLTFNVLLSNPESQTEGDFRFYIPYKPFANSVTAKVLGAILSPERVADGIGPDVFPGLTFQMRFCEHKSKEGKVSCIPSEFRSTPDCESVKIKERNF
jgi:hypothetical protein